MILGSYLISMAIRPTKNVKLTKWNIMDAPPTPTEHGDKLEYFVMVTHGLQAGPMEVILDFEVRTRLICHDQHFPISNYVNCIFERVFLTRRLKPITVGQWWI